MSNIPTCSKCGSPLTQLKNKTVCFNCGYVPGQNGTANVSNNQNSVNTIHSPVRKKSKAPIAVAAFLLAIPMFVLIICVTFILLKSSIKGPDVIPTETTTTSRTIEGTDRYGGGTGINIETAPTRAEEAIAVPQKESLTNMDPYTCLPKGYGFPFYYVNQGWGNTRDIFGNTYSSALRTEYTNSAGTVSATYRLDHKYTRLEFTLAIPERDMGCGGEASIYIYADGDLIFERTNITSDAESEKIVLPLNCCNDITIEMYKGKVGAFEEVNIMICDPMLYQ